MALVYIDDLLVYARNFEELLERLDLVLTRCREHGLTFKPSKCSFGLKKLKFLGHVVSGDCYEMDPDKVSKSLKFSQPKTPHDLLSFLGLCNYYRKDIYNFAQIAAPLYAQVNEKVITWNEGMDEAFAVLKFALCSAPVLQYPDPEALIKITTDASGYGIAACCEQSKSKEGPWHPIVFCSRSLKKHERQYSATHRECLGVVFALRQFRQYFYGRRAAVVTYHMSLTHLMQLKDPYNQLARWALEIASYQVDIVHAKGTSIPHVDALSRNPGFRKEEEGLA